MRIWLRERNWPWRPERYRFPIEQMLLTLFPGERPEYPSDAPLNGLKEERNVIPYREGDAVSVAGCRVEVLETPGHTPGSVTLRTGDVLFTGDTLFAGSMGRTDLPGGDEGQIMKSLRRLYELEGDLQVLPGHEGQSTLEQERKTNYCMHMAMRS